MPEGRVFRPRSEIEDRFIDSLMRVHVAEGNIQKASWTQYISWLLNRDASEIRGRYHQRVK